MTRTSEKLTVGLMATLALAGVGRTTCAGQARPLAITPVRPAIPRVRTDNRSIAALIEAATEQSATFKTLVDTIAASDGIVYVEEGHCGRGARACLLHSITFAGRNRVLRVLVNTREMDRDLTASIGHELRHAVEVLSDRSLTSDPAIYHFYKRMGSNSDGCFETAAAISTGNAVRAEVEHSQARSHVGERRKAF